MSAALTGDVCEVTNCYFNQAEWFLAIHDGRNQPLEANLPAEGKLVLTLKIDDLSYADVGACSIGCFWNISVAEVRWTIGSSSA